MLETPCEASTASPFGRRGFADLSSGRSRRDRPCRHDAAHRGCQGWRFFPFEGFADQFHRQLPNSVSPARLRACLNSLRAASKRFHGERPPPPGVDATSCAAACRRPTPSCCRATTTRPSRAIRPSPRPSAGCWPARGNGLMMSGLFQQQGTKPCVLLEARLARRWLRNRRAVPVRLQRQRRPGAVRAAERVPVYVDLLAHTSLWGASAAAAPPPPCRSCTTTSSTSNAGPAPRPGVIWWIRSTAPTAAWRLCARSPTSPPDSAACWWWTSPTPLGTHGAHGGEGLVAASLDLGPGALRHGEPRQGPRSRRAHRLQPPLCRYFAFESLPAIFSSSLLPPELVRPGRGTT